MYVKALFLFIFGFSTLSFSTECPSAISDATHTDLIAVYNSISDDHEKLITLRTEMIGLCYSTAQALDIVELFTFPNEALEYNFISIIQDRMMNPEDIQLIKNQMQ
ncbi:MAG: hypothetical protein ACPG4W_05880 [Flavobacteriales bacterium]